MILLTIQSHSSMLVILNIIYNISIYMTWVHIYYVSKHEWYNLCKMLFTWINYKFWWKGEDEKQKQKNCEKAKASEKVHAFANHCNGEARESTEKKGATQYRAWKIFHFMWRQGEKEGKNKRAEQRAKTHSHSRVNLTCIIHTYMNFAESWVSASDIL